MSRDVGTRSAHLLRNRKHPSNSSMLCQIISYSPRLARQTLERNGVQIWWCHLQCYNILSSEEGEFKRRSRLQRFFWGCSLVVNEIRFMILTRTFVVKLLRLPQRRKQYRSACPARWNSRSGQMLRFLSDSPNSSRSRCYICIKVEMHINRSTESRNVPVPFKPLWNGHGSPRWHLTSAMGSKITKRIPKKKVLSLGELDLSAFYSVHVKKVQNLLEPRSPALVNVMVDKRKSWPLDQGRSCLICWWKWTWILVTILVTATTHFGEWSLVARMKLKTGGRRLWVSVGFWHGNIGIVSRYGWCGYYVGSQEWLRIMIHSHYHDLQFSSNNPHGGELPSEIIGLYSRLC